MSKEEFGTAGRDFFRGIERVNKELEEMIALRYDFPVSPDEKDMTKEILYGLHDLVNRANKLNNSLSGRIYRYEAGRTL